jgi:hypothetical protein
LAIDVLLALWIPAVADQIAGGQSKLVSLSLVFRGEGRDEGRRRR